MTVNEAIARADAMRPNRFTAEDKRQWLSDLDGRIVCELIDTHEDPPAAQELPYDADSGETALIVPAPYDELYIWYLISQIDLNNAEISRYNNDRAYFNDAYRTCTDYYNRTHMPKSLGCLRFSERRTADALSARTA